MTADPLTTELENAVEQGLAQGQPIRMTGGMRPANKYSAVVGHGPAPLADMLASVTEHNENLKAHLDQAIRDLQDLREKL